MSHEQGLNRALLLCYNPLPAIALSTRRDHYIVSIYSLELVCNKSYMFASQACYSLNHIGSRNCFKAEKEDIEFPKTHSSNGSNVELYFLLASNL